MSKTVQKSVKIQQISSRRLLVQLVLVTQTDHIHFLLLLSTAGTKNEKLQHHSEHSYVPTRLLTKCFCLAESPMTWAQAFGRELSNIHSLIKMAKHIKIRPEMKFHQKGKMPNFMRSQNTISCHIQKVEIQIICINLSLILFQC